jgi:hypothetical protein
LERDGAFSGIGRRTKLEGSGVTKPI